MPLPTDATLQDVLNDLSNPEDYVCGALDNLHKCKKAHGNAKLRIGITGSGQKPYYRITHDSPTGEQIFDTFFDNHKSFSEEGLPITGNDQSWSSARMTLAEVATLCGTLRR